MSQQTTARWSVDNSLDQLRKRRADATEKDYWHCKFFNTEAEARAFIIQRAKDLVTATELTLKLDKARLRKCIKKFGEAVA